MMETNDQAIETYQQQIAPLANALQHTSDLLGSIEQPLGEIYNRAEQSGDETMLSNVMAVWGKSQELAQQLPPFVAALTAGTAALDEVRQQRDDFARELSSLVRAIEVFDVDDSRLATFAEVIESEVTECMYDDALDYADEQVEEWFHDQFVEFLMMNFDTAPKAAGSLIELLRDNNLTPPTEEQHHLIQQLLDTFKPEVKPDVSE